MREVIVATLRHERGHYCNTTTTWKRGQNCNTTTTWKRGHYCNTTTTLKRGHYCNTTTIWKRGHYCNTTTTWKRGRLAGGVQRDIRGVRYFGNGRNQTEILNIHNINNLHIILGGGGGNNEPVKQRSLSIKHNRGYNPSLPAEQTCKNMESWSMQAYKRILKLLKYYYLHNSMRIKSVLHIIYFYYILYTIINILMQIRLKFKIETSEVLHLEHSTVLVLELGLFEK
jgi:hypothetical protein